MCSGVPVLEQYYTCNWKAAVHHSFGTLAINLSKMLQPTQPPQQHGKWIQYNTIKTLVSYTVVDYWVEFETQVVTRQAEVAIRCR